ncbi:MAG: c-type cytochrome [Pseudomonadota bacterium]
MRSTLMIVIVSALFIMLPIWLLAPPIFKVPPPAKDFQTTFRFLSEPALAGGLRFEQDCASCHGRAGEGGGSAPGLLDRAYASDFRNVPSFHDALKNPVPAHQAFIAQTGKYGRLGFNERELLAKFLRELRRRKVTQQR